MLRVGPDQQDGVHDWHEELGNVGGGCRSGSQIVEQTFKSSKISVVLSGLSTGDLNFLLELTEGASVSGLVLLEEFQDLLDSLIVQLFADGIEILALASPESNFYQGTWVVTVLESSLGVQSEHGLDLLSPVDDGLLKKLRLVLA